MSDTPPPAFPGTSNEPNEPNTPSAPPVPPASNTPPMPSMPSAPPAQPAPPASSAQPTSSAPRVSDYGTPPQQPTQQYSPAYTQSGGQYSGGQSGGGQYGSGQQYPAAPYAPGLISPKKGPNGLALTSVLLGGLALLGSFIPIVNFVTGFIAFIGLVLGVIAIFMKGRKRTLAIVGSSLSLLALILSIVLAITYTGLLVSTVESVESNYPTVSPIEPTPAPGDDTSSGEQGAPVAGDVGSRENPAPLGSSIELTQLGAPTWQVTVNAPTLNADAAVAAENSFSDTAPPGTSFALLPMTITYIGAETGYPAYVQVGFEASDGTVYNEYDVVAIAPDAIDAIAELTPGTSASGNVAIAIPTTGVEQGVWVVSSLDGTTFYFKAQ